MPDDRTTLTELGTALGTLPFSDARAAVEARPPELHLDDRQWDELTGVVTSGRYPSELATAFANGRALLEAPDGLRDRLPRTIEWTGGRRPPGDEVAPIDLRIDHVYLVSCKYESDILANTSPARLFDGLLATAGTWDRSDWYAAVAPGEYVALYRACRAATGLGDLPDEPGACGRSDLARLRVALAGRAYPDPASRSAYAALCRSVSEASARHWRRRIDESGVSPEVVLWRLLRIGSAPYFVLGRDRHTGTAVRYRIGGPWEWRDRYALDAFRVTAGTAGQPRVDWEASVRRRDGTGGVTVAGHVEIRWSHGRFAQPPEAKVYLDTPMAALPGYHPLTPGGAVEPDDGQLTLWGA